MITTCGSFLVIWSCSRCPSGERSTKVQTVWVTSIVLVSADFVHDGKGVHKSTTAKMPTLLHFFVFLSVLGLGYGFYLQRKLLKRDKWARPVQSLQHAGTSVGHLVYHYEEITIPSLKGIYFADLTSKIKQIIAESEIKSGQVCILSKHTTTSVTINEMEARLVDDSRQFLQKLAPSAYPYLHNDLHLREGPSGLSNFLMNSYILSFKSEFLFECKIGMEGTKHGELKSLSMLTHTY